MDKPEEIRKKLERYCSYQERCSKEVLEKLRLLGVSGVMAQQIIKYLIQQDYLNEERYARGFARGKFTMKKWGRLRIVKGLKANTIPERLIKIALTEIDAVVYRHIFESLAEKRFSELNEPHLLKKKKKLADYLLYKGWEPEWVYEKVNELIE